ncbi:uncharacterized protein LOC129917982 [Episyrphus balteatus]|uniref:uncharacterized protein LOC129917982 n=1 Tax=Episyrphus balteatus TaxID=286459 RepID=UPI002485472A|nr:uncharacterized protein LOC129917982 [Episyrphus balteatus]
MMKKISRVAIFSIIFVIGVSGRSHLHKNNEYVNVTEHPGELCLRTCVPNDKRICYFKFELELYQAMGVACGKCAQGVVEDCNNPQCIVGDGVEKGVMSINRQVPGPAIQTCQGDMIIVDVVNKAHGTASAIHWHGLHMKDTPWMDGVPYVTQCPNLYGSTFRYWFDAKEPGTHFYHSHSGHHKINGQYGALIVREPEEDVANFNEYDYDLPEHFLVLSDWMHAYGEQLFPGLPSTTTGPDALLINGRGTFINPKTMEHLNVPARKFYVKSGMRYRFRVINAVSHACPMQLQVQDHDLNVIASDSFNVEPSRFDTIVSNSGERYDFILNANHSGGDFWIKLKGLGACASKEGFALLRYETDDAVSDAERPQPPFPPTLTDTPLGRILNDPLATCSGGSDKCCVTELTALDEDEELRTKEPDQQLFVAFKNIQVRNSEIFQPGSYPHFQNPASTLTFVGAINNISTTFPASPPLTQPLDVDDSEFCNALHMPARCEGKKYCSCHHLEKLQKGGIIEIVVVDESATAGNIHHPFHLHGYAFMVTGLGQHPSGLPMTLKEAKKIEKSKGLVRYYKSNRPPIKDTVSIPNRGYAIIRFRADNPGFWVMHCHYEWHFASGMGLIIQVGSSDEMVKPPADFPKCNNYEPKLKMPNY